MPAAPLTTMLLVVAGLALMPLQFVAAADGVAGILRRRQAVTVTPVAILYLLLLGVVGSGVSTMVFIWMVLQKGPLFAGMTTYVVPVLALLWGTLDQRDDQRACRWWRLPVCWRWLRSCRPGRSGPASSGTGGGGRTGDIAADLSRGGAVGNAAAGGNLV